MSDTVFIFGAGFSYDAGIPLLRGFVNKMLDFAIRKKYVDGTPLSVTDQSIFDKASAIRNKLDSYHGRAFFDDRNIEDILSLLSFVEFNKDSSEESEISAMNEAIARTIELTCNIKFSTISSDKNDKNHIYEDFWRAIFKAVYDGKDLPTIITFNYDLVLERSLLNTLKIYESKLVQPRDVRGYFTPLPEIMNKFSIVYHYKNFIGMNYEVKFASRDFSRQNPPTAYIANQNLATSLDPSYKPINILKLHGSVNFTSKQKTNEHSENFRIGEASFPPLILPPVFNKMTGTDLNEIWSVALKELGEAKRIVIVGYSLPQTDIYMQYFLKAALGKNNKLQDIIVFDPELHKDSESKKAMQNRYASCFSPQIQNQIIFEPTSVAPSIQPGTTKHFIQLLTDKPADLLY